MSAAPALRPVSCAALETMATALREAGAPVPSPRALTAAIHALRPIMHAEALADQLTERAPRPLTPRQFAVREFLRTYHRERGVMPSFDEIRAHFGFRSLSTVHMHLENLAAKGHIRRTHNLKRSIELVAGGAA